MRVHSGIMAAALSLSAIPGTCAPVTPPTQNKPAKEYIFLSGATRQKVRSVQIGMSTVAVNRLGLFLPEADGRPGWSTFQYKGPLLPAEVKKLRGRVIKIDVQIVKHPGPMSVFNPPGGTLNPTTTGERIAVVSFPYAAPPGPVTID